MVMLCLSYKNIYISDIHRSQNFYTRTPLLLSAVLTKSCITFIVLTVAFNQQLYSVNESDGQVTIALELSRPAGQNVTIGVRAIPNTAQGNYNNHFKIYSYCVPPGNNVDFDSTRKIVTFGPDDTLSFFDVFINNDAEVELEENFTLSIQLSRVTVRIGVELGDPSETVVVINDDDEGI